MTEHDAMVAEIESLRSQLDAAQKDRQALIDGEVWERREFEDGEPLDVNGWWYIATVTDVLGPFAAGPLKSADEALDAYRAALRGGSNA